MACQSTTTAGGMTGIWPTKRWSGKPVKTDEDYGAQAIRDRDRGVSSHWGLQSCGHSTSFPGKSFGFSLLKPTKSADRCQEACDRRDQCVSELGDEESGAHASHPSTPHGSRRVYGTAPPPECRDHCRLLVGQGAGPYPRSLTHVDLYDNTKPSPLADPRVRTWTSKQRSTRTRLATAIG